MIGGNITAYLQTKTTAKNAIGEAVATWQTQYTIKGFLDLMGGDSRYTTYYAKIEESTHIFLCDYVSISELPENSRMLINGKTYDVMLIDNPMGLNQHLEIYLKYTGGQNG